MRPRVVRHHVRIAINSNANISARAIIEIRTHLDIAMTMKPVILISVLILSAAQIAFAASIEVVANSESQWTGVTVSQSGRVFVNFPRWVADVPVSVAELDEDGEARPYPNVEMNGWQLGEDPLGKFVCVQSVYIDANDRLWILDAGNPGPEFLGVVEGGARLFEVDLSADEVVRTINFDYEIAPPPSYLNDVRVDTNTNTAYITESELGGIVVVDLETGNSRRVLAEHELTKAENINVVVGGIPLEYPVASDGIALDVDGGWLYFQALTGRTLYRVPTNALRDASLDDDAMASRVERFALSGVSDGLLFTPEGVYVSALEDDSIKLVNGNGEVATVVDDPRILWPDSFAREPDGSVVFTTSQIHLGENPPGPYRILRIVPD
jgi:sugar lactone lactonase YvrE